MANKKEEKKVNLSEQLVSLVQDQAGNVMVDAPCTEDRQKNIRELHNLMDDYTKFCDTSIDYMETALETKKLALEEAKFEEEVKQNKFERRFKIFGKTIDLGIAIIPVAIIAGVLAKDMKAEKDTDYFVRSQGGKTGYSLLSRFMGKH